MPNLYALSPLGFATPHTETIGDFTVIEIIDRAMASVISRKGYEDAVTAILEKILKQPAPSIGECRAGNIDAFWIGQSQWMLAAPFADHEDIVASFIEKFKGKASLTEQTDGWCRFAVSGSGIDRLCSLLCNADMRRLKAGGVTRTAIEHIGCFVLRLADDKIQIIGPRSSAGSLHHAIVTAARSAPF